MSNEDLGKQLVASMERAMEEQAKYILEANAEAFRRRAQEHAVQLAHALQWAMELIRPDELSPDMREQFEEHLGVLYVVGPLP